MKTLIFPLIVLLLTAGAQAQAAELFSNACAFEPVQVSRNMGTTEDPAFVVLAAGGLSYSPRCQNLMMAKESMEILGAVLMRPALAAMRSPQFTSLLAGDALTAGITVANPTVLVVVIGGAMAGGLIYVVINREIDKWREAAIQETIKLEIERVTGVPIKRPIKIKVEE